MRHAAALTLAGLKAMSQPELNLTRCTASTDETGGQELYISEPEVIDEERGNWGFAVYQNNDVWMATFVYASQHAASIAREAMIPVLRECTSIATETVKMSPRNTTPTNYEFDIAWNGIRRSWDVYCNNASTHHYSFDRNTAIQTAIKTAQLMIRDGNKAIVVSTVDGTRKTEWSK